MSWYYVLAHLLKAVVHLLTSFTFGEKPPLSHAVPKILYFDEGRKSRVL